MQLLLGPALADLRGATLQLRAFGLQLCTHSHSFSWASSSAGSVSSSSARHKHSRAVTVAAPLRELSQLQLRQQLCRVCVLQLWQAKAQDCCHAAEVLQLPTALVAR